MRARGELDQKKGHHMCARGNQWGKEKALCHVLPTIGEANSVCAPCFFKHGVTCVSRDECTL